MSTSLRIILCGCLGRMGTAVSELVLQSPDFEIVAGVNTISPPAPLAYPVFDDIRKCTMPVDIVIDYFSPTEIAETLTILNFCAEKKLPLVIGTTALPLEVETAIAASSKKTAILHSPNMSLGINLLTNLLQRGARLLYDADFDIEIIEKHHNQKLDAPSGTAVLLGETINEALGGKMRYVHDRSCDKSERARDEIGMHALRGGSIVGEHSVVFAGPHEVVELTHIAQSRDIFATGTLKAARFIVNKPPGLYTMQDLINEKGD